MLPRPPITLRYRSQKYVFKQIAPAVSSSIDITLTQIRQKSGKNFEKVPQVALQTVEDVGRWLAVNPGKTAIIVTSGVVLLAPGLVSAPALGALGFGPKGVGAGSIAAGVQAGIGNVAAGSAFSILQGAGAGGASEVVVNGVLQGIYGIAVGSKVAKTVMKTI
ncbi:hypothetical protein FKW77_008161 [Venturia effusa]|uniref:Uncharacterized protein n=1 Tax=Venturia effusa TaxID=50376 RepID=A0A517KWY0_9PEZI|nr:hypothetical protein FKW77_008161 [Venturia effusa]